MAYRKRTELAAELLTVLAGWLPEGRLLTRLGDREYVNGTLVPPARALGRFIGPLAMNVRDPGFTG